MRALRTFKAITLGVVLAAALFACGGGDEGGIGGGSTSGKDYSLYSGTYTVTYTITDSSDSSRIGRTGTWTSQIMATVYGYATVFYPNAYCGEILSSGVFGGNTIAFRTAADGWHCGTVTCCNGGTTMTIKFTDLNSGTLSRQSTSCCSAYWEKSSGTVLRQ